MMVTNKNMTNQTKSPLMPGQELLLVSIKLIILSLFYFIPFNLLDGNEDWLSGIGFIIVWSIDYYRRLKSFEYVNSLQGKYATSFNWKYDLIIILVISSVFYLSSGMVWQGFVIGVSIILGGEIANFLSFKYINRFVELKNPKEQ